MKWRGLPVTGFELEGVSCEVEGVSFGEVEGIEMGVVRLLAPHLTSLMWLGVVASMCHAPSLVVP